MRIKMEFSYIRIYRDEVGDEVFERYCAMEHSQLQEEDNCNSVVFYTADVNDVESKDLV